MQFDVTREICRIFAIPIYDAAGFEADDILGTIIEQTKKNKNLDTVIASGDMDTLQLVDGGCSSLISINVGLPAVIPMHHAASW